MAKPLRNLLIALLLCLVLLGGAWLLLRTPQPQEENASQALQLSQRNIDEVAKVEVQNTYGTYTVLQENGIVTVHDIPAELVNTDYVAMLLDECSNILYESVAGENVQDLAPFGLQTPEGTVLITYTDGSTQQLLFGAEEPVSGGRYCKTAQGSDVLLMKNGRTVRFTMPVEKYINFIITPPNETSSILSVLQDITFSGTQLPQPIVLKAVREDRADILRQASSFGAVTHLITQPQLHEADQTQLLAVAESLLGLLSEGVVDYNCTQAQLAAYGFTTPDLQVEFDYQTGKQAPLLHYNLRLVQKDGGYLATLNDQGVVYQIAAVDFTQVSYESLILRWFLSPFITDVAAMEIAFDGRAYRFDMQGETAKELVVTHEGAPIDAESYRKFYNLVLSAAAEGNAQNDTTQQGTPVLEVRFIYKDTQKPDDVMALYAGPTRRVWVEINGICEFSMRETYVSCIKQATLAVTNHQNFESKW